MKTVGIIGGIGPESTIEYYRIIIAGYRQRQADKSYPSIVINSVDLNRLLDWMKADQLPAVTDYLVSELEKLARAGVDFGALASNTPHIVFGQIRERSPIPLISIVESTRDAAQALGLKRVGLFGTRYTMRGRFYSETFAKAGMTIFAPHEDDQE